MTRWLVGATLCAATWLAAGCEDGKTAAPAASASAVARVAPGTLPRKWPIPTGPVLAVVAGEGVGAMRLGASVETIERAMDLKCDDRTDEVCRYVTRAVEFKLKGGLVVSIHVHRPGRAAGPDRSGNPRVYGIFNGAIPPDLRLGMHREAVQAVLGKPARFEDLATPGVHGTVGVDHHPGMRLEYDRVGDKIALGGVVIEKPGTAL